MSDFITNAELRIEAERLVDENERLQAENAKMRDLIKRLYTCANEALRDFGPSCYAYNIEGCGIDCTDNGGHCCMAYIKADMHELGISEKA